MRSFQAFEDVLPQSNSSVLSLQSSRVSQRFENGRQLPFAQVNSVSLHVAFWAMKRTSKNAVEDTTALASSKTRNILISHTFFTKISQWAHRLTLLWGDLRVIF